MTAAGLRPRDSLLLGAVQGLTEFLPVSSSAHLALLRRRLRVTHPRALDIALHLGSTAALVIVMRRDLARLRRWSLPGRDAAARGETPFVSPAALVAATLPAVLAGAPLHGRLEGWERRPARVAAALLLGSAALAAAAVRRGADRDRAGAGVGFGTALVVGLAQVAALAPGVSRSGATIAAATLAGLDRRSAARLSFLLAVPVTLAANLRALPEVRSLLRQTSGPALLAGGGAAAATALAGAALLPRWLTPRGLLAVALYRCALAGALLLLPSDEESDPHRAASAPDAGERPAQGDV